MPPPLAVLATLALVLALPRRVPLAASFLVATILLPLLCGLGVTGSSRTWSAAAFDPGALGFAGTCCAVFVLSSILTHGGHLAAACDLLSGLIPRRRVRAAVMPAVVGLVPMPGGAVVSAPLIDRALGGAEVSPETKNLVNYWFRHVWEVSWPLYPAVVMAAGFAGSRGSAFMLAQAPLTLVLALVGWWALLRAVPPGGARASMPAFAQARVLLPFLVLAIVPATPWGAALGPRMPAVAAGLAIVVALATAVRPAGLPAVLRDSRILSMTVLAWLTHVYGDLVVATGASTATGRLLADAGLPHWVAVLLLPYLIGFATGGTLPFVAVTFPIVVSAPDGGPVLPWLTLGYAAGFAGYLTSPVHMCLVLSTRYFNSKLLVAYGRLLVPVAAFLAAAVATFLILGGRFAA